MKIKNNTQIVSPIGACMRRTFTLVELLVVIAIIAILASMLLPALNKARESARASTCLSAKKQLYNAFLMYVDDSEGYCPPTYKDSAQNSALWTWGWALYDGKYCASAQLFDCPSVQRTSAYFVKGATPQSWWFNWCGTGYNTKGLGQKGWDDKSFPSVMIARIRSLSTAILFADTQPTNSSQKISYGGYFSIDNGDGHFAERHSNTCPVMWGDGHATMEQSTVSRFKNSVYLTLSQNKY